MELDKKTLKERLLEIARLEAIKYAEDVQQEMKKSVKLEKNIDEQWVKIIYLGGNIKRSPVTKEGFNQILRLYSEDGNLPEYEIFNEADHVKFQFKDGETVKKIYNHYNDFFFGNMQQQAVNNYLSKYIHELMDEGCASGSCGCSDHSCGAHTHSDEAKDE